MGKIEEAKKLLGFVRNKDLAVFNELTDISSKLEDLTQKETDMSPTNELLQEVVTQLKEPTVIRLILD